MYIYVLLILNLWLASSSALSTADLSQVPMIPLMAQPQTLHLPIDAMEQETWWKKRTVCLCHKITCNLDFPEMQLKCWDLFERWLLMRWTMRFVSMKQCINWGNVCFCLLVPTIGSKSECKEISLTTSPLYFCWSCLPPRMMSTICYGFSRGIIRGSLWDDLFEGSTQMEKGCLSVASWSLRGDSLVID